MSSAINPNTILVATTYNIKKPNEKADGKQKPWEERKFEIIENIEGIKETAHIICIQEFSKDEESWFSTQMKRLGYAVAYQDTKQIKETEGLDVAVLYKIDRFNLLEKKVGVYTDPNSQTHQRHFVQLDLEDITTKKVYRVASIHLFAGRFIGNGLRGGVRGYNQLKDFRAQIEQASKSISHIILAGDFNSDIKEEHETKEFKHCKYILETNTNWHYETVDDPKVVTSKNLNRHLDWIFVGSQIDQSQTELHMSNPVLEVVKTEPNKPNASDHQMHSIKIGPDLVAKIEKIAQPVTHSNLELKEKNSALIQAANSGNLEEIINLLRQGANLVTAKSEGNRSVYELLIHQGHLNVVRKLLEYEHYHEKLKVTANLQPIHRAIINGNEELLKKLQSDHNICSIGEIYPLHLAVLGKTEIVRMLLTSGANIKARSNQGVTPLQLAAKSGHLENVKVLLKNGADPKRSSEQPGSPMREAVANGHVAIVKVLLENGADIEEMSTTSEYTPLHVAVTKKNFQMVTLLVDKGANIHAKCLHGYTPLELADEISTKHSLASSESANSATDCANCPRVCEKCELEPGEIVEDSSSSFSPQTNALTPEERKNLENIISALKAKAELLSKNNKMSSFDNAVFKNTLDIGQPIDKKESLTHLHTAILEKDLKKINELVTNKKKKFKINAATSGGFTHLHLAAISSKSKIVEILLDAGADIDARSNRGVTSLQLAARNGLLDNVILLLQKGADPKRSSKQPGSPLQEAVANGHVAIVEVLLENGANIEEMSGQSECTPLHVAVNRVNLEMVTLLLKKGTDKNAKNKKGETPLDLAKKNNYNEIINLLSSLGAC